MTNWCSNGLQVSLKDGNAKQQFSDFHRRVKADCLQGSKKSLFNFTEPRWDDDSLELVNDSEGHLRICFESAWGPPENWLSAIRDQYPGLNFALDFSDGMGTEGIL